MTVDKIIHVIDDDEGAREGLVALLSEHGYKVEAFDSASSFLEGLEDDHIPGCVILDIKMPGMSGLELQEHLLKKNLLAPIIFVTGHGTISWSVQAMKRGAINFLEKPYNVSDLISSINEAFEQDALSRRIKLNCVQIAERFKTLTRREKEVIEHLVFDKDETTNKLIAQKLNISHRTVEEYRAEAMRKLQAGSLKELITMVIICKLFSVAKGD